MRCRKVALIYFNRIRRRGKKTLSIVIIFRGSRVSCKRNRRSYEYYTVHVSELRGKNHAWSDSTCRTMFRSTNGTELCSYLPSLRLSRVRRSRMGDHSRFHALTPWTVSTYRPADKNRAVSPAQCPPVPRYSEVDVSPTPYIVILSLPLMSLRSSSRASARRSGVSPNSFFARSQYTSSKSESSSNRSVYPDLILKTGPSASTSITSPVDALDTRLSSSRQRSFGGRIRKRFRYVSLKTVSAEMQVTTVMYGDGQCFAKRTTCEQSWWRRAAFAVSEMDQRAVCARECCCCCCCSDFGGSTGTFGNRNGVQHDNNCDTPTTCAQCTNAYMYIYTLGRAHTRAHTHAHARTHSRVTARTHLPTRLPCAPAGVARTGFFRRHRRDRSTAGQRARTVRLKPRPRRAANGNEC